MRYTKQNLENWAKHYEVKITYDEEDAIYVARVPELPGTHSHGATREIALKNVAEAIELTLRVMNEDGAAIPLPLALRKVSGKFQFRPGEERHRILLQTAEEEHKSANDVLNEAFDAYIAGRSHQVHLLSVKRKGKSARARS